VPKAVRVQALDATGRILHEFPSIAAAAGAGFCAATISMSLNHGKDSGGLRWVRTNGGKVLAIDRLEAIVSRLESVAERLEGAA
jgi:hypothetical protein